jgi:hypothetical protein
VSGGRVPDFFIVGQPKSGTTALWEILSSHPQIFMSEEKELWFFSPELASNAPPRKPFALPRDLDHYRSQFAGAGTGQITGEASTTYLWSPSSARLIAAERPDAKIVAVLREPASFIRSLHLQYVESNIETEPDLARALALEDERRAGALPSGTYWPQLLLYSDHVRYAEQLRRYFEVFPREQVLVLIYEELRADNAAGVREVLGFLGVEQDAELVDSKANQSVVPRSMRAHRALEALTTGRGPAAASAKRAITAIVPRGARARALETVRSRALYRAPQDADAELMASLRRRWRGEVQAAGDLLERDLIKLWGYDES